MRSNPKLLSVVIPLYNEEDIIEELVTRLNLACQGQADKVELVFVDDGSIDRTVPRLNEYSKINKTIRVLSLARNYGHMPALTAGMDASLGDCVIVMDGDLQDPPELIEKFVKAWRAGADVAYGLRSSRDDGILRGVFTGFFYWLLARASKVQIPRNAGTFGIMDRSIVDAICRLPERDRFFAGLRAWAGGLQVPVEYERSARNAGGSRVGFIGLLRLAESAFTGFSKLPLQIASLFSLLCSFFMFAYGFIAIVIRLFTNLGIPGWATTTALLGLIGFVQSLVLAMMGIYLSVIFDEIKGRPLYRVHKEYRAGKIFSKSGEE